MKGSVVTEWLRRSSSVRFSIFTGLVAFLLYTCVYGFRKTFSVATFSGQEFMGMDLKVWLVTAQVAGYAVSKFIGIKVVSEIQSATRKVAILAMMSVAGTAWLLFGLVPAPYNIVFLFINGLPLGMIWGLIFSYLEGRKMTDALGAALSVSFIVSSGLVKMVGALLMLEAGVSETWMPFVASAIFALPLLVLLWLLDQVPAPSEADQELRTRRQPMDASARRKFMMTFGPGLFVLIVLYTLLTALRDFRDNFTPEIWAALGFEGSPQVYTSSEIVIAIIVLLVIGSLVLVKDNRVALQMNHLVILAGLIVIGVSTVGLQTGVVTPFLWMILTGAGLYMGYVPFNAVFYERLIAAFKYTGTVGFVIYLSDSFGYLGSVLTLLLKEFYRGEENWASFFVSMSYVVCAVGGVLTVISMFYFEKRLRPRKSHPQIPAIETARRV